MKNLFLTLATILIASSICLSQHLPIIELNKDITTHFNSQDQITYVDVSTNKVIAHLPLPNLVSLKPKQAYNSEELGVITIVTKTFIAQYRMIYTAKAAHASKMINLNEIEHSSLGKKEQLYSQAELIEMCQRLNAQPIKKHKRKNKEYQTEIFINNIYTEGNLFFIDISMINHTNINYTIADVGFRISDKKVAKATNNQDVELNPIMSLRDDTDKTFSKTYRNVYVFEKFTYPDQKHLLIEYSEMYYSARQVRLQIPYRDILNADLL